MQTSASNSIGKNKFTNINDYVAKVEKNPVMAKALANERKKRAALIEDDRFALAKLRLEQGLSQNQLAEHMGKEQSYIARIEKGDGNVTVNTIIAFVNALGLPDEQVFIAFRKCRMISETTVLSSTSS